ncbi:hypothetical protein [Sphingomonas oryzagri]
MRHGAMHPHTRALVAASAHAVVNGRKIVGVYDHAAGRYLRIAAECRGQRLQGVDGDRPAMFGGTLPEIFDDGDKMFISLQVDGTTARGYDRGSSSAYVAEIGDRLVQLYDHGAQAWFAFDIQTI